MLLSASYFNQDDYYLTSRAFSHQTVDRQFLFEAVAGHVQPAQQLVYWIVAHHAAFDWGRVASGILVVEILTVVAAWHVLSRLLPGRWSRVPLLAVFAWTPLTLVSTLWWSAAMGLWPPMLFLLLATLFFLRAQDGAGRAEVNLLGCVLSVLIGLSWHERGILAVAVVVGIAVARSPQSGLRRVTVAAVRWWPLWVALAAMTGGYLVLHRTLTSVEAQHATFGSRLDIARAFLLRNTLPGLSSGPWKADIVGGAVVPARWVEVLAALLAIFVAVMILRHGGPARWPALVMLGGYVTGDLLMLLLGRAGFGEIIGLDPRYTADVVAAAVLFTAVALEGTPRRTLSRRISPVATAVGLSLIYLVGSVVTTAHIAPHFENREDRRFIGNLRADLAADPEQVLLDRLVPAGILLPLLGEEAKLSVVLAPLPEHPTFDEPGPKLRMVGDDGKLRPVRLFPLRTNAPGADGACGFAVSADAQTEIPLVPSTAVAGPLVIRLEVFTDRASDYRIRIGKSTQLAHVIRGPQVLWVVVPGNAGPFTSVGITGTGPATLCVVGVVVGTPVGP
jgi:hypothetical protein